MTVAERNITPWLVDAKDFPKAGSRKDQMKFLLRYAVLAPSFYNSQPWQFEIDDKTEEINVYADKNNWFRVADPDKRELYVSIGCALENLLIAADYFQLGHQTAYFPDLNNEDWVANIRIVEADRSLGPRSPELFDAITDRRTNYKLYDNKPLVSDHVKRIRKFLTEIEYKVYLDISDDPDVKAQMDRLIGNGKAAFFANDEFRHELKSWIERGDFGSQWLAGKSRKVDAGDPQLGEKFADNEQQIVDSAPAVAILSSEYDNRISQVKVGQTFERISLEGTLLGLQIHPMYQLMEIPELKTHLQGLFPEMKGYPQLVFSMGYTKPVKESTPRKPVEDVLI